MTENNLLMLRPIRRAVISVSNKEGIIEFARTLKRFDVEIISTGGTAAILRDAGVSVRDVSDVTGFPEMMDGRVKTLHPKIHGGLLALRNEPRHLEAMTANDIEPIDMVVVNLYPFAQTIAQDGVTLDEAIEQIDIGGPAMVRSAAKNWRDVAVVTSSETYGSLSAELAKFDGQLSGKTRGQLAKSAFVTTAMYDATVSGYLMRQLPVESGDSESLPQARILHGAMEAFADLTNEFISLLPETPSADSDSDGEAFEDFKDITLSKMTSLRYGENPHQRAALYEIYGEGGVAHAQLLSGKEMSFNNYVDADAAWHLVSDFETTAVAIIKHTNPSGVGLGMTALEAYQKALATDPLSAFGGIVAFNRVVDAAAAHEVAKIFTEVIIAPEYDAAALEILQAKKNLRVLLMGPDSIDKGLEYKQISGGMLAQTRDTHQLKRDDLRVVTIKAPSEAELDTLLFAWTVCKHTKSNAIVYARPGQTVGVGAGQMSRVDSVKIGAMRAQLPLAGCVLASDAFFPFRDGIDEAARTGIAAIIQPGGSVRDGEVIAAANEHGLAMVFTGIRHFNH